MKTVVTQADADSVIGPTEGGAVAISVSEVTLNLTEYEGMYVDIQPDGVAAYAAFDADGSGTINLSAAVAGTAMIPVKIAADGIVSRIVPIGAPILHLVTASGSGTARVVRS